MNVKAGVIVRVGGLAESVRQRLGALLEEDGVVVASAPSLGHLLANGDAQGPDLIIAEVAEESELARTAGARALSGSSELVVITSVERPGDRAPLVSGGVAVVARDVWNERLAAAVASALDDREVGRVADELPVRLRGEGLIGPSGSPSKKGAGIAPLKPYGAARDEALTAFERRYLTELLESVGGRVGEAARRARMSPRTLYNKMRRHRLRKEDFKA